MRARISQRSCSVGGWLCLAFAAFTAITWYFWCPLSGDFGVIQARATYNTMVMIPPFVFGSGCLLYLARRIEHRFAHFFYWLLLAITVLIWFLTFRDFY